MPGETLLTTELWPQIGMDDAPTINKMFRDDRERMAQFGAQLLLYDRIVIPTNDFAILDILATWLGFNRVVELFESDSLRLIRLKECLGFAGNGNGLCSFTIGEGEKRFLWWQDAAFGDFEESLQARIDHLENVSSVTERHKLFDLVRGHTKCVDISVEDVNTKLRAESMQDLLSAPLLRAEVEEFYGKDWLKKLKNPPEVGPNVLQVANFEIIENPVHLLLRIAELNLGLLLATGEKGIDMFASARTEQIYRAKLSRSPRGMVAMSGFCNLLDLSGVPDVQSGMEKGIISISDIWRIRSSKRGRSFRKWMQQCTINESKDLAREYIACLERAPWISRLPVKVLRFLLSLGIGAANPIAGIVASIGDSFLLEPLLSGHAPGVFINELRSLRIRSK